MVHMKVVCIDGDYCFSGSANHGIAGFGHNCELNTRMEGICCEEACRIFDGFYHGAKVEVSRVDWFNRPSPIAAEPPERIQTV
jgi:phosphatidylserine/phosphatidylglycerophosphate/cardiolipin synthase-like enzyme